MNLSTMNKALAVAMIAALSSAAAPKNIILFIGDGMGPSQLTTARFVKDELEIARCPIGGLMTTYSSDNFVTDSAASGTALASGFKTSNGTIGQTPEGTPLKSALEVAEEKGKATGLVATSSITHATPASFSAHVAKRKMEPEIAEQIANQEIEVLLGGGRGFFIPASEEGSKRKDEKNLLKILESKMTVISTNEELQQLGTPKRLAGFFDNGALPPVAKERPVVLADMTAAAIKVLSQYDEGFFLMVEGSQIDWGGHANDADYVISETIDFDDAVGVGLDFAQEDGDTLVIVTSDHETGGFVVLDGSVADQTITKTAFASKKHSASMVPIFSYGPGAEAFGGIRDNTDVGRLMIDYLNQDRPGFFKRLFN